MVKNVDGIFDKKIAPFFVNVLFNSKTVCSRLDFPVEFNPVITVRG
jgi:hypothetical protein